MRAWWNAILAWALESVLIEWEFARRDQARAMSALRADLVGRLDGVGADVTRLRLRVEALEHSLQAHGWDEATARRQQTDQLSAVRTEIDKQMEEARTLGQLLLGRYAVDAMEKRRMPKAFTHEERQ